MSLTRRQFASTLALGAAAPSWALAQGVTPRILAGFPAGGSIDTTARLIAESWRGRYAASVLVEQKVGAGGRIAIGALKDAAPDGLTLLLSPASMFTIYPHVYRRLAYNPVSDVIPVTSVCNYTCGFGVGPMVPASVTHLAQYVEWAKANPKQSSYGSPAAGAMPHFLGNQFEHAAGITLTHVPYRGAAPGMQELMGGQIASGMFALGDYLPHLNTGKIRLLGITDTQRSRFAPNVPTFPEQGYKRIVGVETFGLFVPAKTPQAVLDRLYDLARVALREKAVTEGMAKFAFEPTLSSSSEQYARQLAKEREQWAPIVKASGFSSDD